MAQRDFYDVLGVGRDADEAQIKSAFRKKAMEYHPDRNSGDGEAERNFKQVNEAYEILKDGEKRAAYDRFGHAAFEQAGGPGQGGFGAGGFEFNFGGGNFGDIFEDIFGDISGMNQGGRRRQPTRGQDLRYNMEISLEDGFTGKQTTIRVPSADRCASCGGSGSEGGAARATCGHCGGRGRVRASQGFFTVERTCVQCQGEGEVIENPCRVCKGAGRVRSTSRPASTTAPGSASPARASPVCAARRRATSTSSCRSPRTRSSTATAPTSIARCRCP